MSTLRAGGRPATRLSISEVRRRLPELVKRLRQEPGTGVLITVHDEIVAELRAARREPPPGAAARRLLALMARLPATRGRKTRVSSRVKDHLYGPKRAAR